jgi:mannose-1-phosphate guanylyltransferase
MEILYAFEESALGTAGAIRNAAEMLSGKGNDPIIVFNGDILGDHSIAEQVRAHVAADADVTLHLTQVGDPRAFGVVPTTPDGWVTAFLEKTTNPPTNMINGGCYVMRRKVILDSIPKDEVVSVERETFPDLLVAGARVLGFPDSNYWLDLGTPPAFAKGSSDLVRHYVSSRIVPSDVSEALLSLGATVEEGAVLTGGTVVGVGAHVASGATIHATIIMEGAIIGSDARVSNSIIGRGARIGGGCQLSGAVIGDGVVIGPHNIIPAETRIWPGKVLGAGILRVDGTNPIA